MPRDLPAFRKYLPLTALVVCTLSLEGLIGINYLRLQNVVAEGGSVQVDVESGSQFGQNQLLLLASVGRSATFVSRSVQALNFPGMLTEVVVSMCTRTWPDSWRPSIFGPSPEGLFIWRGLIFPLYCLPFWWFAGLGLDAFFSQRYLHWSILLLGTLLTGFFLFLATGLAIASDRRDYQDMAFVFCGFAIWIPLLSMFPATWLRQLLRRRAARAAAR